VGLAVVIIVADMNDWLSDTAHSTAEPDSLTLIDLSASQPESTIMATEPTSATAVYASDFLLTDLYDDDILYSLSKYQGRPIILNFWASWCGPCRVEMPAFQEAHEKHADDGLVILAINQTFIDDIDAARDFADEIGLTFPLLRDDDGRVSEGLYGVRGLPTTVVVRPDGSMAFAQIGPMNNAQIADVSRRFAAGEPVP
jgi:thiol-disulfide isomerase/thioredoxin